MSQKILVSTNYKNQGQSIQGKKEEGEKRWQGEESNQNLRLKIQNNKLLWYFSLKVKWKYRVSQKTWEFSDEFDIVFVMN